MNAGFSCLLEGLGELETERFVSILLRERADYTKWRQRYFNGATVEDFNAAAVEFAKVCPFQPEKTLVEIDDRLSASDGRCILAYDDAGGKRRLLE